MRNLQSGTWRNGSDQGTQVTRMMTWVQLLGPTGKTRPVIPVLRRQGQVEPWGSSVPRLAELVISRLRRDPVQNDADNVSKDDTQVTHMSSHRQTHFLKRHL